ncbi:hypothetical protein AXF42_Ash003151 [Apostasia shenzhenica]|uniref:Uncharacterized protein n=1 Tax=Apostasia shenzhenica TaxID=1088818 RepID=A0A2I0BFB0_9ASPA|nr:hypothetical protein AXF42_Ash003151 [Apostasia shenzhenica]
MIDRAELQGQPRMTTKQAIKDVECVTSRNPIAEILSVLVLEKSRDLNTFQQVTHLITIPAQTRLTMMFLIISLIILLQKVSHSFVQDSGSSNLLNQSLIFIKSNQI